MTYTIQGGTLQTRQLKLNNTSAQVLVDGGQAGAIVVAIYAAALAGTPSLTLEKWDGTTSVYLRYQKPMAANEEFERDILLVLKSGESLRATASAANAIDVTASYIPRDAMSKGNSF